jgi:hypothetical protein
MDMTLRRTALLALPLLLVLAFAACGAEDELALGPSAPAYSGTLEESADGRVLVRGAGDACGIWLAPADDATVLLADGDGYAEASWDDLARGQTVDVWISGPIAESCPMQADADAVLIRGAA